MSNHGVNSDATQPLMRPPAAKKYPAPLPPTNGTNVLVSSTTEALKVASAEKDEKKSRYIRTPMQVMPSTRYSQEANVNRPVEICQNYRRTTHNKGTALKDGKIATKANIYSSDPVVRNVKPSTEMIIKDGYIKLCNTSDVVEQANAAELQPKAEGCSIDVASKPVVSDVKLIKNESTVRSPIRTCKSTNAVDSCHLLLETSTESDNLVQTNLPAKKSTRSSFVDPNGPPTRCSVYIELGEYQTLLKRSTNPEERIYSLPQPQCYGDNTLKAVKLITEKYDTFKRRELHGMSFRSAALLKTVHSIDLESFDRLSLIPHQCADSIAEERSLQQTHSQSPCTDSTDGVGHENTVSSLSAGTGMFIDKQKLEIALLRDYCSVPNDMLAVPDVGSISLLDRLRIEMFYRSQGTSVFVSFSLADVYVGSCAQDDVVHQWIHIHTGVPVWLLNSGTNLRRRELSLVIAEKNTGFPLWLDKINYFSNYHELSKSVHLLRVGGSLCKMAKINSLCDAAAEAFMSKFHEFSADPNDELWNISDGHGKRKGRKKCKKLRQSTQVHRKTKIEKSCISRPCNFVHVSCVDPQEPDFRAAFADLLPFGNVLTNQSLPQQGETADNFGAEIKEFRPRLPTS